MMPHLRPLPLSTMLLCSLHLHATEVPGQLWKGDNSLHSGTTSGKRHVSYRALPNWILGGNPPRTCGTNPMSARYCLISATFPFTLTSPPIFPYDARPATAFKKVLFPLPLGPITPTSLEFWNDPVAPVIHAGHISDVVMTVQPRR